MIIVQKKFCTNLLEQIAKQSIFSVKEDVLRVFFCTEIIYKTFSNFIFVQKYFTFKIGYVTLSIYDKRRIK